MYKPPRSVAGSTPLLSGVSSEYVSGWLSGFPEMRWLLVGALAACAYASSAPAKRRRRREMVSGTRSGSSEEVQNQGGSPRGGVRGLLTPRACSARGVGMCLPFREVSG